MRGCDQFCGGGQQQDQRRVRVVPHFTGEQQKQYNGMVNRVISAVGQDCKVNREYDYENMAMLCYLST